MVNGINDFANVTRRSCLAASISSVDVSAIARRVALGFPSSARRTHLLTRFSRGDDPRGGGLAHPRTPVMTKACAIRSAAKAFFSVARHLLLMIRSAR
jgi:hypothetical protein